MPRSRKISHISNLLNEVFRKKGWGKRLGLHAVFHLWDKVVGKEVAGRAQPHVIRGTVLWVKVSDSIWMQQLHLQKSALLDKLNQRLKGGDLSDIRFQLDASLGKDQETSVPAAQVSSEGPDPQLEEEFDKMISSLADEAIRKELKELWLKYNSKRPAKR